MKRAYNFNAGPSALPLAVLEKAQKELVDFQNTGMSVMELSHRSKEYEAVHNRAKELLYELLQIPENYDILFLQGGASTQFSMIPMNLLQEGQVANYVLTGSWSEKALKEAKKVGATHVSASSKDEKHNFIPALENIQLSENAAYLHITSNNTIYGTQWKVFPKVNVPLIADMSSDILSRPLPVENFGMIYAGAQKNLGPSGVTVVIIRKDLIGKEDENIPTMLKYSTHAEKNSLYNTPPTFGIYMLSLVLEWVKEQGGVKAIEKANEEKAAILYDAIDASNGFYIGHAKEDSRSLMNVTFNLSDSELEKQFLQEAKEKGFVGLNGHRSIGGCRASIYNAVPKEACIALRDFMIEFQKQHG
ncbi:3-phosphoserine/phosphohydroxythreonine transaminase [Massilibacterium senegalense]|uniref:3-phosphoserine/phosphohydroxythreonine transaminase n=1 Tax=Massilibacterium senegalense TaxID=1632858 RepID=UPI000784D29A|nr:3-phosphoserine/phosphohydroxythreonine transaminase [Massilibacterium senegalense]